MSGRQVSRGRPRTGRKTLKKCNNSAVAADHVLIDVEGDTFSNVILIDEPDSVPNKFRGNAAAKKEKRKSPLRHVIFIDDDESSENEYPEFGVEDNHHFFHDPSPSMRSCSTSKNAKQHRDNTDDDCQFVQENVTPVKLSKCKRTYSGKAPVQNRYGLTSDSEGSSSDNDEIMEDYAGQLREQWQKASLKRKNNIRGQPGFRDINSSSGIGVQPVPGQSDEHPACSGNSKSSTGEDLSAESAHRSPCTSGMADAHNEREPQMENFEEGCPSMPYEYQRNPFEEMHRDQGNERNIPAAGPCLEKPVSCGGNNFPCRQYRVAEEDPPHDTLETTNDRSQYMAADNGKYCQEKTKKYKVNFPQESRHDTSSFSEKEDLVSDEFPRRTNLSSDEHYPNHSYSNGSFSLREPVICTGVSSGSGISGRKFVNQENGKCIPDRTSKLCALPNETQPRNRNSLVAEDRLESVSMNQEKDEKHDDMNDQDDENVDNCIISERERFKETSEYKKALEEELASRQRALAVQAEEAKKLKLLLRRKKAESMRLLEMEKRQKQRVDEMRETQKKDLENMNMKELIRAETRKQLCKLELSCHDMASVLRGLGITVGGGTTPSSHEVHVAYKKALLKFHPDRASKSDIRQQVEAEEKFKLISRMKDKYLKTL